MVAVRFLLNGRSVQLADPNPAETVLDWLRIQRHLTGTKEGCNEGDCGACTVMLTSIANDGVEVRSAVNSCLLFLPQLDGKSLRTVEGVADESGTLHPVQRRMVEYHGSQCGFCTPGFVMSMVAAHGSGRRDHDDILAGNLCRCTGYAPIVRAARAAEDDAVAPWLECDADRLRRLVSGSKPTDPVYRPDGYFMPGSADDLADWSLANPDGTLVGGATDLGLVVNKDMKSILPMCFVSQVRDLGDISPTDGGLAVGATASISRLRDSVKTRYPDFGELLRRFGSEQVRNVATIGGNIANGSPIGDGAPPLIALGATLTLRRGNDRRTLDIEDFFVAYGHQDLQPGEFIESLYIPDAPDRLRCYKLSKRFDQDISAVLGCFNIVIGENGTVESARIAFGGMAGIPKRAHAVESRLIGRRWNEKTVSSAALAFESDFVPISDLRASAGYRMTAARHMLRRCFLEDSSGESRVLDVAP